VCSGVTPGSKRALELSAREARLLRHDHIGTEHVLALAVEGGKDDVCEEPVRRLGGSPRRAVPSRPALT